MAVPPGGGRLFTVRIDRQDGFDGPVTVTFDQIPAGWVVTGPIVIEAGQWSAEGAVLARPDAIAPTAEVMKQLVVSATGT